MIVEYFLFEKQTFNEILKFIGIQLVLFVIDLVRTVYCLFNVNVLAVKERGKGKTGFFSLEN